MTLLLTIVLLLPQNADEPTAPPTVEPLTLEMIMSDPAWIGASPERPQWSVDASTIVFSRRRDDSSERDVIRIDPLTGEETVLSDAESDAMIPSGDWNPERTLMITSRQGDLILFDRASGESTQLTRTTSSESRPRFLTDGRIAFRRDGVTIIRDLKTGIERETARIRFEDEPEPPADPEGLTADQRRIFDVLRDRADDRETSRLRREARRDANEHDVAGPIRLDPGLRSVREHLSPDGRWMLLETAPARRSESRADAMPVFVTDDGYVEQRRIRSKVGSNDRTPERLFLIDLLETTHREIDLKSLPERTTDRLDRIRAENLEWRAALDEPINSDDDSTNHADPTPEDGVAAAIGLIATTARQQRLEEDEEDPTSPPARPVSINTVTWSSNGDLAAIQIRSHDNKDRWTTVLDPTSAIEDGRCTLIDHLHDPAWIGWGFNELGWLRDQSALWFLSEADGWSDLLIWRRDMIAPKPPPTESDESSSTEGLDTANTSGSPSDDTDSSTEPLPIAGTVTPLVAGRFEVKSVRQHPTDDALWFISNRDDPSIWRLERVEPGTGWTETMVNESGMVESFAISPDGERVLFLHSSLDTPSELHVRSTTDPEPGTPALTRSTTALFDAIERHPPTLVDIPGRHGRPIRGRLHLPPAGLGESAQDAPRPAVLFVHGAGYLQNAHAGWSRYFREGLFHDLLAREGFVVLDLDYRASAGYGRDWRTAIARDMGPAELDDLEDGIAWLSEQHDVDPERVGVYGGSYGGFVTLMGLFTRPGTFACGAALRPVTDWAHYNDGYTRNILNAPEDDPMAYRRSSPIEHAEGLEDPLLICHGMVDDNVAFQDTVRLAQRLIELEKENWEVAVYPVEAHGFREPTSWLDEYRRIRRLFRAHLIENPR